MSTGETSSLIRRANRLTGKPDQPLTPREQAAAPPLKPMTGAQLAFRPSAPPRTAGSSTGSFAALPPKPGTGAHAALKPTTGTQPALKPQSTTGTNPAFKPLNTPPRPAARPGQTGTNPAFKPLGASGTSSNPAFKPLGGTGTNPAFKPSTGTHAAVTRPAAPPPAAPPEPTESEEAPVFDMERLQAQIRHLGITDSALGRAVQGNKVKPTRSTSSAAEDTFVKSKMKEAEAKVPDFSLDEDLG
jgi:hypothetical protein